MAFRNVLRRFSTREVDILNLVLQGKNNGQIAEVLDIQKRTVENYISRIYDKTGFSSRSELIEHFLQNSLER